MNAEIDLVPSTEENIVNGPGRHPKKFVKGFWVISGINSSRGKGFGPTLYIHNFYQYINLV